MHARRVMHDFVLSDKPCRYVALVVAGYRENDNGFQKPIHLWRMQVHANWVHGLTFPVPSSSTDIY